MLRDDYIGLIPEAVIVAKRAREWQLSRRNVRRYMALVKARYTRERDAAGDVLQGKLEGMVEATILRTLDTERRAREADDYKSECAAQTTFFRGADVLCRMRGFNAPEKREVTHKGESPSNPFHLRARIKAEVEAARSGASVPLSERKTEGNA